MSDFVFGSFTASTQNAVAAVTEALGGKSSVVFKIIEPGDVPLLPQYMEPSDGRLFQPIPGFQRSRDSVFFCLVDSPTRWDAEDLTLASDWSPLADVAVPLKLTDRIALIVDLITTIAERSGSPVVELWMTKYDQREGIVQVLLSSLGRLAPKVK